MMVFWLVAAMLMAAALLLILPPLLQSQKSQDVLERDEINLVLYKDQLAELEADLASGDITQDQFDQAHADLERSLLQDISNDTPSGESKTGALAAFAGNKSAIAVGVFVPVFAILMYLEMGNLEMGLKPEDARPGGMMAQHDGASIEEQIRKLQEHLQENPDDIQGWVMMARSYYFMKQYQAASDAFSRTVALTNNENQDLLADYADALAMAQGRSMIGKPYELVKQALAIQPFHQKALWLAATAAYQQQDYKAAEGYYQSMLKLFPENSENYIQILRNIGEVKQLMGENLSEELQAALRGELQPGGAVPETQARQSGGAGGKVSGMVSLAENLQSQAAPDDTVFIFARASQGPRMPLAILKVQVKDLPMEFTLDDSLAMTPQASLSKFSNVIVGARVSKSGDARPNSGDLSGALTDINVGTEGLKLVINSVIP